MGNPPYLFITEVPERDRSYYQDNYQTVAYRFDLYGVFIEKALTALLRRKGLFGFIIPHTLLSNDSFQALRSLLAAKTRLYRIVNLGPGAFQDAKNETMLLFFDNSAPGDASQTEVVRTTPRNFGKRSEKFVARTGNLGTPRRAGVAGAGIERHLALVERMQKQRKTLGDFCTANQGLRTGDNERFLSTTKRGKAWEPAAGGKEIGRYAPIPAGLFVRYEPALSMRRGGGTFSPQRRRSSCRKSGTSR